MVNILPFGSESVDQHTFADSDPESQNLPDPDPKHCFDCRMNDNNKNKNDFRCCGKHT